MLAFEGGPISKRQASAFLIRRFASLRARGKEQREQDERKSPKHPRRMPRKSRRGNRASVSDQVDQRHPSRGDDVAVPTLSQRRDVRRFRIKVHMSTGGPLDWKSPPRAHACAG